MTGVKSERGGVSLFLLLFILTTIGSASRALVGSPSRGFFLILLIITLCGAGKTLEEFELWGHITIISGTNGTVCGSTGTNGTVRGVWGYPY